MSARPILRMAAALAAAAWCAAGGAWGGDEEAIRLPERLGETGLYAAPGTVDPLCLPYSPQYPLWSDGAVKSRWIRLPAGRTIDASDDGAWGFPVGTKLWKEFAFAGRKVETRMLWRATPDTWVYGTYVWNDDQTEATLAPEEGIRDLVEIAPGKRHSIPGVADCKTCHESGPSRVLGFNALQLSDDRDPLAPHAEPLRPGTITLRSLVEARLLDPSRPDLVDHPPRIEAASPRERAALGYLAGNCGHCHNAAGPLSRLGLVLAHDPVATAKGAPEPALATAIEATGRFRVPGIPEGTSRLIAPGAPDRSAVVYRMRSRRPASQMPPLGTVVPDDEAVRLVGSWISEDLAPSRAGSR